MDNSKATIIAELQKDILSLQGYKRMSCANTFKVVPPAITNAFYGAEFPLGVIHEFINESLENAASTCGFVSGILATLMRNNGVCIWISNSKNIFPSAMQSFGIAADKVIFIDVKKEKETLWVMEEALKCESLAAVVGEIQDLSFIASRRLQLAVEESKVTGFVLRHNPRSLNTTACVTRWKIRSIPSELHTHMPGVGFPRWKVELLKVRNGKPGTWEIEFSDGKFRHISKITEIPFEQQKKTG